MANIDMFSFTSIICYMCLVHLKVQENRNLTDIPTLQRKWLDFPRCSEAVKLRNKDMQKDQVTS